MANADAAATLPQRGRFGAGRQLRHVQIIGDQQQQQQQQQHPGDMENGSTFTRAFQNPYESLRWRVGLSNEKGRFLTAEPFGFKLNVSGSALKKRQTWILVPDPLQDFVYLKSHLGRFLSADADGGVSCSSDKPGLEERFSVEYDDSDARWALRSAQYGLYFGGEEDRLSCFSKTPRWWRCHLAVHPQLHVKNLNRGRYLRLSGSEISADRLTPWGPESLVTLQQVSGRVAIRTADGRLLDRSGRVVRDMSDSSLFGLRVRCGPSPGLAFRAGDGRFLTNVGASGTARTKNSAVSKDELYVLEDSYPQICVAACNGRYVSIRQGHDLNANQSEVTIAETYQLEYHAGKWRFRTKDDKFWKLAASGNGITATGELRDAGVLFEMQHLPNGKVSLRAANEAYLSAKRLGGVSAGSSEVRSEEQFQLRLLNRPVLVFRCDFGFVGVRNSKLECNLVNYDIFQLEASDSGYYIKGAEGYWNVTSDCSISFRSSEPEEFLFEFRSRSCVAVRCQNGRYVRGEQNGTVRADSQHVTSSCLWEY